MTSFIRNRGRGPWLAAMLVAFAGATPAFAQSAVISGRVASDQGRPLPAANVYITDLNVSVATNEAGRYTIALPAERVRGQAAVLRVRAIGFKPDSRQITVSSGTQTVDFSLSTDVNRLDEVVITGVTGATTQKDLPFTVSKIDASSLPVPAADPLTQLQGKVPGAQITSVSGRPGSQPAVLLRGPKSINASGRGQDPLYIVDGVLLNGSLPDINSQDIESVEVVKGAAASSLYGSRAGNGVIQITTKRGRATGNGINFGARTEYGVGDIPGEFPLAQRTALLPDLTGLRYCTNVSGYQNCARSVDIAEEARRINEQATSNVTLSPVPFTQDYGVSAAPSRALSRGLFQITPWPKTYDAIAAATTTAPTSNTNLDMNGRFGSTSFFASAANFLQQAPFQYVDGFRRQSLRLNVDNQVNEQWQIGLTSYYSKNHTGAGNLEGSDAFFRLTRVPAGIDLTMRDALGRLLVRSNPLSQGGQNSNTLYLLDTRRQTDDGDRFLGNLNTTYRPTGWLTVTGNLGYDKLNTGYLLGWGQGTRLSQSSTSRDDLGYIERYNESDASYNANLNAAVTHSFADLQTRVNAQYLYEQQDINWGDQGGRQLASPGVNNTQAATQNLFLSSNDQSVRANGVVGGVNLVYKGRYIADALIRRDGSSLFGSENRYATYGRGSLAWRVTEEPWWSVPGVSDLKFRGSIGSAGGRPRYSAQYETFTIGTGGVLSPNTLGNDSLKPEITVEQEYGVDAEFFHRVGLNVTYANAKTRDQILLVPTSAFTGFQNQWQNAGVLLNKTWEASLNVPIMQRRNFTWTARLNYDRNRTTIDQLGVPAYPECVGTRPSNCQQGTESMFLVAAGERFGTIYGNRFITSCSQLPSQYASQCGTGKEYQKNNEGLIVWVGQGYTQQQGITQNLWQSEKPGCVNPTTKATIAANGAAACAQAGGVVNAPFGIPNAWGNAILLRDSVTGLPLNVSLGHTLPDYRTSLSQTMTFKKLSVYGLLDGSFGQSVWNEGRHWSYGDFQTREQDQTGTTVETAKPLGHYWRGGPPENGLGSYGFYNTLAPNSRTVERASFVKLREVNVGYAVGPVAGVGDWTVSVIGRNLHTFTDYTGFDPEVGRAVVGGASTTLGSGAINGVDAFQYPNLRTFTFSLATRF